MLSFYTTNYGAFYDFYTKVQCSEEKVGKT